MNNVTNKQIQFSDNSIDLENSIKFVVNYNFPNIFHL